jgi:hypothetical protein
VVSPAYDEPKQSCLEDGESVAFCSFPRGSLNSVSCASESLCVAVGYEGSVYVSTDPTGGAKAWSVGDINDGGGGGATHLISVSCPSPTLCVAVSGGSNNSNGGKVLTSTDPTSGHWQEIPDSGGPQSSPAYGGSCRRVQFEAAAGPALAAEIASAAMTQQNPRRLQFIERFSSIRG